MWHVDLPNCVHATPLQSPLVLFLRLSQGLPVAVLVVLFYTENLWKCVCA